MRAIWLMIVLYFSAISAGVSQSILTPEEGILPEQVIEIQLQALQFNHKTDNDLGIRQVWAFAHPNNKKQTGPYERFALMIKNSVYKAMLDHKHYEIVLREGNESEKIFEVLILTKDLKAMRFFWHMALYDGSKWMTLGVTPPISVNQGA